MIKVHNLGFPRIGANRELKWAVEKYWKKEIDRNALQEAGDRVRHDNWQRQIEANHDFISVGDFSWYDHVLDTACLLGVMPARFLQRQSDQANQGLENSEEYDIDTYFRMARGRAPTGQDTTACEMTKWFDTNYHYIVPEFSEYQTFKINCNKLFNDIKAAQAFGKPVKPILLGPLTFLWLGKSKVANFDKLALLKNLLPVYKQILSKLRALNIEWVQMDEPILVLDLPDAWQQAFKDVYAEFAEFANEGTKLMLATYFGQLDDNLKLACQLPVAGLHIDAVRGKEQIAEVAQQIAATNKILSIGIVDGRNIWRNDLRASLNVLKPLQKQLPDRLWLATSCSLLHCPVDLSLETKLDDELKSWMAFATQKLHELDILRRGLRDGETAINNELNDNTLALTKRKNSPRIHNARVKQRCAEVTAEAAQRKNKFRERQQQQKNWLNLPLFPTTTIGSFPQTQEIREIRQAYKAGKLTVEQYREKIYTHIEYAIRKQLELGLDVLVHGEAERNDMVEYFGESLEGFAFTKNGWVQSYGSRCVKPPVIFGDVSRPQPITIEWASYAQSLTDKPVKGMLTGPITILCWSFVRDDQSRFETAKQIAVALRDEVADLVAAGIKIIQIDEPAIREGLPLRVQDWQAYLQQAVLCFGLAASGVDDHIQIHTHMCYSEFNDIIEAIADLDADVITIETSRSDMELLKAFENFQYPNEIGPGVYDIHSPRIPTVDEIVNLIEKAANFIPAQQLWINPDCGLKTRDWNEVESALKNMVNAANVLRKKFAEAQEQLQ